MNDNKSKINLQQKEQNPGFGKNPINPNRPQNLQDQQRNPRQTEVRKEQQKRDEKRK